MVLEVDNSGPCIPGHDIFFWAPQNHRPGIFLNPSTWCFQNQPQISEHLWMLNNVHPPESFPIFISKLLPLLFLCYCNHFGFYSYRHWIFISTYDRWYIYIYIIDILLHHIGIEYLSLLIPIYDIYYIHLYGDSEIWYTHIYTIHIDVYLSPLSLYTIHLFPHISPRWAMATLASPAPWPRSMLRLWHRQSWWPRCTMDGRSCWEPWKMWKCGDVEEIRCGYGCGMILDDRTLTWLFVGCLDWRITRSTDRGCICS